MDVKQHSTNQPTHTMHSVAYPSKSTEREMFSCLLGRTVHRDYTRSARDEGGGWEWGGVGGRGGGRKEEGGGGECGWRGNLLKSSSQAKSGESVGHHHTFPMGSSAISMLNMVYLVLNFCVLHLFLDNRMQPLYLFLLVDRTLLKRSASRFSDIALFFLHVQIACFNEVDFGVL